MFLPYNLLRYGLLALRFSLRFFALETAKAVPPYQDGVSTKKACLRAWVVDEEGGSCPTFRSFLPSAFCEFGSDDVSSSSITSLRSGSKQWGHTLMENRSDVCSALKPKRLIHQDYLDPAFFLGKSASQGDCSKWYQATCSRHRLHSPCTESFHLGSAGH